MITLSDIRRALEQALTHEDNPALLRLPESERTVEGILRAYLPGSISQRLNGRWFPINVENITRGGLHGEPLDLSDPGTCHAVLVVLALADGRDPGPLGLGVSFYGNDAGGWTLRTPHGYRWWSRPDWSALDWAQSLSGALLHVCPRSE